MCVRVWVGVWGASVRSTAWVRLFTKRCRAERTASRESTRSAQGNRRRSMPGGVQAHQLGALPPLFRASNHRRFAAHSTHLTSRNRAMRRLPNASRRLLPCGWPLLFLLPQVHRHAGGWWVIRRAVGGVGAVQHARQEMPNFRGSFGEVRGRRVAEERRAGRVRRVARKRGEGRDRSVGEGRVE